MVTWVVHKYVHVHTADTVYVCMYVQVMHKKYSGT